MRLVSGVVCSNTKYSSYKGIGVLLKIILNNIKKKGLKLKELAKGNK